MATNNINYTVNLAGNINNGGVGPFSGNTSTTPVGIITYENSLPIPLNVWTQVATGSNAGTASVIAFSNTSNTGSITVALSASGEVNNLGTAPATNGVTNNASLIQWNNVWTSLWAIANVSASTAWFVVIPQ
jgi:hypothetical protein